MAWLGISISRRDMRFALNDAARALATKGGDERMKLIYDIADTMKGGSTLRCLPWDFVKPRDEDSTDVESMIDITARLIYLMAHSRNDAVKRNRKSWLTRMGNLGLVPKTTEPDEEKPYGSLKNGGIIAKCSSIDSAREELAAMFERQYVAPAGPPRPSKKS